MIGSSMNAVCAGTGPPLRLAIAIRREQCDRQAMLPARYLPAGPTR